MPFISEFVFRSPRRHKNQKEIADLLISQGDTNIVFSQKCQEDPTSRSEEKNALWVLKEAKHGLSQLQGGLKKFTSEGFWCAHPRRGRVEFNEPLAKIDEAIVLVETLSRVDLNDNSSDFPLEHNGVPITYLSVNDFLNLVNELRTVPELLNYLKERRCLPEADMRIVGDEAYLFPTYFLNDRHFDGCKNRQQAKHLLDKNQTRFALAYQLKKANDRFCMKLEDVAHQLSVRNPHLTKEEEQFYEPKEERSGYLKMQLAIADLDLPERISLGKGFIGIIEKLATSGRTSADLTYGAFLTDSKPDWVFVFAASQKINSGPLVAALSEIAHGALAAYQKTKCLIVADREGAGYEVAHLSRTADLTDYQIEMGERHFAKLKMFSQKLSLLPE